MNNEDLSERDICTKFITPALAGGGRGRELPIREVVDFTALGNRMAGMHDGSSLFTDDAGGGESNIGRPLIKAHLGISNDEMRRTNRVLAVRHSNSSNLASVPGQLFSEFLDKDIDLRGNLPARILIAA